MIVPIRCHACGCVIAEKYPKFKKLQRVCSDWEALYYLGVKNTCCRGILMNSIDLTAKLMHYDNHRMQIRADPREEVSDQHI